MESNLEPPYHHLAPLERRGRDFSDDIATVLITFSVIVVASTFLWLFGDIVANGFSGISLEFLTDSPSRSGRSGGIGPILLSTFLILSVAMSVSLPLGIATAMYLSETQRTNIRLLPLVRQSLDILAGVPSIVFGLFGNALFCIYLDLGFSILSGGLTLACMVLPLLIRSAEEGFRSVPEEYRNAAAALAYSRTRTLFQVVLPAALPAIAVGIILGVGRALAETAALIFTSGYVDRTPESLLDSGRALSIHIYDLSMNVPGGNKNAYASALVLLALLFIINLTTSSFTHYWRLKNEGRRY